MKPSVQSWVFLHSCWLLFSSYFLPFYSFCVVSVVFTFLLIFFFQASRSEAPSDGALGETRKQLKEETLLRLVRFEAQCEPFSNY